MSESGPTMRVAVVIPCLNEAASIAKVVADFRAALPDAQIVVVDNASTDHTAEIAAAAGAQVIRETRAGKGFALLTGLREAAPSDVFVMVDGDDTYPAEGASALIARLEEGADMAIGTRLQGAGEGAFPVGHSWGNRLFNGVVRLLFGIRTRDLFSGYRALTSRFLEQSPLIAQGFEIEAELSIQAVANRFRVDEVPVAYRARTGESESKLRTFRDGYRILLAILAFFRDYRPLTFFGLAALVLFVASLVSGSLVIQQYLATGQVLRIPLAVLASGLFILGALSLTVGVLLSSMNRRTEEIRALLLSRRY
ncbi:MAG: glycosyltransferase [bacterium]|nr:glycosyltransferase [bacterium]